MKINVINGPNLNLLGTREPDVYGSETLADIKEMMTSRAKELGYDIEFYESNIEGELVDFIQKKADGIIINAAAYSHYSIAIRDAIKAVGVPAVEVHISNIYSREEFRHGDMIAPVAVGTLSGFGTYGYIMALDALHNILTRR